MSVLGGKAATLAALTGAGRGLRERYPSPEAQQSRIADLEAQREYWLRLKKPTQAAEVLAQIDEVRALAGLTPAPRLGGPRKGLAP